MKNWKIAREIVVGSSAVLGITLVTAIVVMTGCTRKANPDSEASSGSSSSSQGAGPSDPALGAGVSSGGGSPTLGPGPDSIPKPTSSEIPALLSWELQYPEDSGIFTLDSFNDSSAPLSRAPVSGYFSVEPELPHGFDLDSTTGVLRFHSDAYDPKVRGSVALPKGKSDAAGSVLIEPKPFKVIYHVDAGEYFTTLLIGLKSSVRSLGKLPLAVSSPSSVALKDGRILFTGGKETSEKISRRAYLYSPSSGRIETVRKMNVARSGHVMTLLKDGRVWVSGGIGERGSVLGTTEIYDPELKQFSAGPDLGVSRTQHSALVLGSGDVLVTGGFKISEAVLTSISAAELFTVNGNRMVALPPMSTARAGHTATLLSDSTFAKVLIVGGGDRSLSEIFDPRANAWTLVNASTLNRKNHSAVLLSDKRVWIVGGDVDLTAVSSTEFFNYDNLSFSPGPDLKEARSGFQITKISEGRLVVSGGLTRIPSGGVPALKTEVWSFAGGISSVSFGSPLESPRQGHLSLYFGSADVLLIGGDLTEGRSIPSDAVTVSAFNPGFPQEPRGGAVAVSH